MSNKLGKEQRKRKEKVLKMRGVGGKSGIFDLYI